MVVVSRYDRVIGWFCPWIVRSIMRQKGVVGRLATGGALSFARETRLPLLKIELFLICQASVFAATRSDMVLCPCCFDRLCVRALP